MKTVLFIFCVVCSSTALAQQYSGFFRYETGTRIDFSDKTPSGAISEDSMAASAILHVLIPLDESRANISLAYGKDAGGREDQSYTGVVAQRSEDMITIVCSFGEDVDKIETIVIFPPKKVGVVISHSAYFGRGPLMKALAQTKPELPYGSASILRLRQFEQ